MTRRDAGVPGARALGPARRGAGAFTSVEGAPEGALREEEASRTRRQLRDLGIVFTLACVVFAIWMWRQFGGPVVTNDVDNLAELAGALTGGVICLRTSMRIRGRRRRAWRFIAAASLLWAVGQAIWCGYALFAASAPGSPSIADLFFLAEVPLALVGVLLLVGELAPGLACWRSVLDGAAVAASLLAISWAVVLGPIFHSSSQSALGQAVSLAYPLGDVVSASVAIAMLMNRFADSRRTVGLLVIGMCSLALSDSAYTSLTLKSSDLSGLVVNVGWLAGFLAFGLGALSSRLDGVRTVTSVDPLTGWRFLPPYLAMAGAASVIIVKAATASGVDLFLTVDGMVLVSVVLIRQFVVQREATRSAVALEKMADELWRYREQLEDLVEQRTEQLRVATASLEPAEQRRLGLVGELGSKTG